MTIGEKIKTCRLEKSISQKELATQIGVDVSFICKVEKNEKKISIDKLMIISNILNINFNEMKIIFFSEKIESILIDENDEFKSILLKNILDSIYPNGKFND